jgi:hypothetical protein
MKNSSDTIWNRTFAAHHIYHCVNTVVLKISVTPNPLQNLTTYADPLPKIISTQTPKAQIAVLELKLKKKKKRANS